jgi:hypothetical protein
MCFRNSLTTTLEGLVEGLRVSLWSDFHCMFGFSTGVTKVRVGKKEINGFRDPRTSSAILSANQKSCSIDIIFIFAGSSSIAQITRRTRKSSRTGGSTANVTNRHDVSLQKTHLQRVSCSYQSHSCEMRTGVQFVAFCWSEASFPCRNLKWIKLMNAVFRDVTPFGSHWKPTFRRNLSPSSLQGRSTVVQSVATA